MAYKYKGLPASQRPATVRQRRTIAKFYGEYPTDWISVEEASILIDARIPKAPKPSASSVARRHGLA